MCGNGCLCSSHCQKSKLATWLVQVFHNMCFGLENGTLSFTKNIIVKCFLICTSPGSLSDIGMMMKVFDDEFTAEFMIAVLPLDVHPAKQIRHISHKSHSRQTSELTTQAKTWPELVTEKKKKQCAKSYRAATVT